MQDNSATGRAGEGTKFEQVAAIIAAKRQLLNAAIDAAPDAQAIKTILDAAQVEAEALYDGLMAV